MAVSEIDYFLCYGYLFTLTRLCENPDFRIKFLAAAIKVGYNLTYFSECCSIVAHICISRINYEITKLFKRFQMEPINVSCLSLPLTKNL